MGPPKVKYSLCCVNICAPSEVKTNYGVLDVAHFRQLDAICPFRSLCRLSYGTPWPSVNNVTAFHRSKMANFGVWWQRLKLHWIYSKINIIFSMRIRSFSRKHTIDIKKEKNGVIVNCRRWHFNEFTIENYDRKFVLGVIWVRHRVIQQMVFACRTAWALVIW